MAAGSKSKSSGTFPSEAFVQEALEHYFASWQVERTGIADLCFRDSSTGFRWIIEARGEAQDTGLDFKAGLGQLLSYMDAGRDVSYGLAMPDTEAFAVQRQQVSNWVRETLNLYWFLIDDSGEVLSLPPYKDET